MFKVMSLNMHSYFEPRTYWAFYNIAKDIAGNRYDAVCLQEVNQLEHTGFLADNVRTDNAAYIVKLILEKEFNVQYNLYWDYAKTLDGLIEEGEAILTPHKIIKKGSKYVSTVTDKDNWRCRKNIYACIEKDNKIYNVFSVHFAWADDGQEKFDIQFRRFTEWVEDKSHNLIVAGDFNTDYKNEDYKLIEQTGWADIARATNKDHLETCYDSNKNGIHIDYILTNITGKYDYKVKFTGVEEQAVSDHRGISAVITE